LRCHRGRGRTSPSQRPRGSCGLCLPRPYPARGMPGLALGGGYDHFFYAGLIGKGLRGGSWSCCNCHRPKCYPSTGLQSASLGGQSHPPHMVCNAGPAWVGAALPKRCDWGPEICVPVPVPMCVCVRVCVCACVCVCLCLVCAWAHMQAFLGDWVTDCVHVCVFVCVSMSV